MWEEMLLRWLRMYQVFYDFTGCTRKGGDEIPSRLSLRCVLVRDVRSHSCTPVLVPVCSYPRVLSQATGLNTALF